MLYDPKWEVETKPDIFSLESLVAWLETMPANKSYVFTNCFGRCLLDQYASAVGIPYSIGRYEALHSAFDEQFEIARAQPWTFGAALERARKALFA